MIMNDEVSANAIMKRGNEALHWLSFSLSKNLIRVAVVLRRVALANAPVAAARRKLHLCGTVT